MKTQRLQALRLTGLLVLTFFLTGCLAVLGPLMTKDAAGNAKGLTLLGAVGALAAGPAGATFRSEDGEFVIQIPPGAMLDSQEFVVRKYSASMEALPRGFYPTSSYYEVTPAYVFQKPVTVSVLVNSSLVAGMNLRSGSTSGFSLSATSAEPDGAKLSNWSTLGGAPQGERVVFNTKTFSIFGSGTPPVGNVPPNILEAYYYFKPSLQYVPYRVRVRVVDPDGDPMNIVLLTGPKGGPINAVPMTAQGGNWYEGFIPYEAMSPAGISIRVVATDIHGLYSQVPAGGPFVFPEDSPTPAHQTYKPDADNNGILDAWEKDNPGPPGPKPDADNDGIPDSHDSTPNGESNPLIDSLTIFPTNVQMYPGESVSFSARGTYMGQPRFISPGFATSGVGTGGAVGSLVGSLFSANEPGLASVNASVNAMVAPATITVNDNVVPAPIANLTAVALGSNSIELRWTATGDDGSNGTAGAYQIFYSTSAIPNDATCGSGSTVMLVHNLVPKTSGQSESVRFSIFAPASTYHFCIRAYDTDGNRSTWAGTTSATTASSTDLVAPANIVGATATPISPEQVRLNWTAVGNDGMTGAALGYEIRRSVSAINTNAECSAATEVVNSIAAQPAGTPLSFIVNGLAENAAYFFCLRAFDAAGNRSQWAGALVAVTPNGNDMPSVTLSANQSLEYGNSVVVSAAGSTDPDAGECAANTGNYQIEWRFSRKPGLSYLTNASIANRFQLDNVSFTPDVPGLYELVVTFRDDPGICAGGAKTGSGVVSISAVDNIPNVTWNGTNRDVLKAGVYDTAQIQWQSDRPGSYQVRVGTPTCQDGAVSTGTNGSGVVAANTVVTSEILVSQLAPGPNFITVCVTKTTGNRGQITYTLYRDETPPLTLASPESLSSGTQQDVTLSCTDTEWTCDKIAYTTDTSEPTFDAAGNITNGTLYTGPWQTPNGSVTILRYRARDMAGNVEPTRTQVYTIDGNIAGLNATNSFTQTNGAGNNAGYTINWITARQGLPFEVRINASDCTSGTLATGTNIQGATSPNMWANSTLDLSNFTPGMSNTVRLCIRNLVGVYTEYPFSVVPCVSGQHAEGLTCVANTQYQNVADGSQARSWNYNWGAWAYILNINSPCPGNVCGYRHFDTLNVQFTGPAGTWSLQPRAGDACADPGPRGDTTINSSSGWVNSPPTYWFGGPCGPVYCWNFYVRLDWSGYFRQVPTQFCTGL